MTVKVMMFSQVLHNPVKYDRSANQLYSMSATTESAAAYDKSGLFDFAVSQTYFYEENTVSPGDAHKRA